MTTEQSAQALEPAIVAAARALCKRASEDCGVNEEDNWALYGDSFRKDAEAALIAAAPHQPAAAQLSGWKLVPVEPTVEMREAGFKAGPASRYIYRAMLDAAPPPPTQPKEPSNGN